ALHQVISVRYIHLFAEIAAEPERKLPGQYEGKAAVVATTGSKPTNSPEKTPDAKTSDVTAAYAAQGAIDLRLRPFIEKCEHFFDRLLEMLPAEDRELVERSAASRIAAEANDAPRTVGAQRSAADPKSVYWKSCEALAVSAIRLPGIERAFSTAWPSAVRSILPSEQPGSELEHTWSHILAYVALHSLPLDGIRMAVFDTLQLRSALADIFSSMGLEDEQAWRMAARVHILLLLADTPSASIETEEFWADSDVRWLAGVNESSGKTYFNKELFEEMLCWVQLPALIEIARQSAGQAKSIEELETAISRACHAATRAGYDLDVYLKLLSGEEEKPAASTGDPGPVIRMR
ncbi:MAG TPA: hypothetical protein VE178_04485, partial [Silvibacterium sp.]|nr:hypothetical protein [Silvibacterium sp.]